MDEMALFGVPIEGLHTETGPGVYEAAILFSEALEAADRAILFKAGAKEIGARFGIMPSFMAKWSAQYPGCSGHLHQSLTAGSKNVLQDAKDRNRAVSSRLRRRRPSSPSRSPITQVRRWDDVAKVAGEQTPPLAHFLEISSRCLRA